MIRILSYEYGPFHENCSFRRLPEVLRILTLYFCDHSVVIPKISEEIRESRDKLFQDWMIWYILKVLTLDLIRLTKQRIKPGNFFALR